MIENIGLVLEGGGMRGLYTAGVLDFFMEKDLYFKKGFGVSAGACHGCSYFCRQPERALRVSVNYLDEKNYCGFGTLIRTGDFFGVEMVYHTIPEKLYRLDNEAYKASGAEFFAVVTNCETGRAEYRRLEDMYGDLNYIRASASLPLLSRMVEIGGNKYLDGGMTDSIPIKFAQESGCKKNIVILTQPRSYRKEPGGAYPAMKLKYRKYPNLLKAIKNRHIMYNDTLDYIAEQEKLGKILVIAPEAGLGVGRIEKDKGKLNGIYEKGRSDGERSYNAIKEFINI